MSGRAGDGLVFAWTNHPPLPPGLDPSARDAMIEVRRAAIFDKPDEGPRVRTSEEDALDLERVNRRRGRPHLRRHGGILVDPGSGMTNPTPPENSFVTSLVQKSLRSRCDPFIHSLFRGRHGH